MAKGFTVKAKTPKKSEKAPEWDYDKAKEIKHEMHDLRTSGISAKKKKKPNQNLQALNR